MGERGTIKTVKPAKCTQPQMMLIVLGNTLYLRLNKAFINAKVLEREFLPAGLVKHKKRKDKKYDINV